MQRQLPGVLGCLNCLGELTGLRLRRRHQRQVKRILIPGLVRQTLGQLQFLRAVSFRGLGAGCHAPNQPDVVILAVHKFRFHFHCLLGGTQSANRITDSHRLEHVWKHVSGGGRVEIRPYSRLLAGPAYFVDDRAGANHYERGKFALAESVTLSRSCFDYLAKLTAISDRRRRQLTRKNGEVGKPGGIVAPAIRGPGTPWVEPLR